MICFLSSTFWRVIIASDGGCDDMLATFYVLIFSFLIFVYFVCVHTWVRGTGSPSTSWVSGISKAQVVRP